jgi:hypothetical protein
VVYDTANDGKVDTISITPSRSHNNPFITNKTLYRSAQLVDVSGDGLFDTVAFDSNGDGLCDRRISLSAVGASD